MLLRSPHAPKEELPPFELKGSLFTLTVLHLFQLDRAAIERHLAEKIKQAPSFFSNTPVVIDLENMTEAKDTLDFKGFYELLRGYGMIPVGVRNGAQKVQAAARLAGVPVLPESRAGGVSKKPERVEPTPSRNLVINHPIRSGQEAYAADGDLIILGSVSAGADVAAAGNIHVYGALRGRALAGVKGDTEAWIFCHSLEAELISIAGHYQISEQIESADRAKAVQIHLNQERLIIEHLIR
jgi:septum site-determining protein MinC